MLSGALMRPEVCTIIFLSYFMLSSALMISSLASSMLITHLLFTTNSSPVNLFRLCSFPISVADFSFHCRIFRRQHLFISAGNEPGSHACMDIGRLPRGSDSPLPVTGYLILTTLIDMYYRPAVNMMYKGCKGIKISIFVYQDYLTN